MRILHALGVLTLLTQVVAGAFFEAGDTPQNLAGKSLLNGLCTSIEIRREWRSLTRSEKAAYLNAVKCLAKKPHNPALKQVYPRANLPNITAQSSFYDDMLYIHMDQTDWIHYTGLFLPWHRWFVNEHVRQLKKQCGYKGALPYWDWSKDAAALDKSPLFDPDPVSGLGTWGDPNNDFAIKDGALASMEVAYPVKHHIRRNFTLYPYRDWFWLQRPNEAVNVTVTADHVLAAINGHVGNFIGFQNATEVAQSFHPNIHMMFGGDMAGTCPKAGGATCIGGSTWTPNDPMFFLHHANMDRIWFLWQLRHPLNFFAFKGGSIQTYTDPAYPNGYPPWLDKTAKLPTNGLFPEKTVAEVLNPFAGDLCYLYL